MTGKRQTNNYDKMAWGYNGWQADAEKKYKKRENKKRKKMKVSGGKIKELQKIISKKA